MKKTELLQHKIEKANSYFADDLTTYFEWIAEKPNEYDFLLRDILITNNDLNVKGSLKLNADHLEKNEGNAIYNLFLYEDGKVLGDIKYLHAEGNNKYIIRSKHFIYKGYLYY